MTDEDIDGLAHYLPDEQIILTNVVGMLFEEATDYCTRNGYQIRRTRVDGQALMTTRDHKITRVNVEIEYSKIVKATIG